MIYGIFIDFYSYRSAVGAADDLRVCLELSDEPFGVSFGINSARFYRRLAGRLIKRLLEDDVCGNLDSRALSDRVGKGLKDGRDYIYRDRRRNLGYVDRISSGLQSECGIAQVRQFRRS